MAWLGTWAKRIEITIDHNDVDATLTQFPVLIYLSASSGINSDDVSSVFDELTADANRKKIAITEDDGTTQLYVEIDKWDDANEKAWLWISKSGWEISSSVDTTIYLYYDSNQSNNDSYVGDTNDAVAENVWDSNFKSVYHMADGADTSHIYDSTSNDNDGTKDGAGEPLETATAQIATAQHFDAVDDNIVTAAKILDPADSDWTIEVWFYGDDLPSGEECLIANKDNGGTGRGNVYWASADNKITSYTGGAAHAANTALAAATWYYLVLTYDLSETNLHWYRNGASDSNDIDATAEHADGSWVLGSHKAEVIQYLDGIMDEIRVSDMIRPDEWIKATYETGRDNFISFGSEELMPSIRRIFITHN